MGPIREDFAGQRQLRFRVREKALHLFKRKGESTHQVYLKVLAFAFYGDQYDLVFDPRVDYKYQPDLASIDLTGEVKVWLQCGQVPVDQIAYILKHSDADEVILVQEHQPAPDAPTTQVDLSRDVTYIRRHIHYRYTNDKLKILAFRPLDDWFIPDDVELQPENFQLFCF